MMFSFRQTEYEAVYLGQEFFGVNIKNLGYAVQVGYAEIYLTQFHAVDLAIVNSAFVSQRFNCQVFC